MVIVNVLNIIIITIAEAIIAIAELHIKVIIQRVEDSSVLASAHKAVAIIMVGIQIRDVAMAIIAEEDIKIEEDISNVALVLILIIREAMERNDQQTVSVAPVMAMIPMLNIR